MKPVVVTSANGRTGRALVKALVAHGIRVRALDHNPGVLELARDDHGQPHPLVEAVQGEMLEPADRRRALAGARALVHIPPSLHAYEADIGHAIVGAAREAKVEHLIFMSVIHPQLEPLLNHQSKLAVERHVLQSLLPFTILQPQHYMQNINVTAAVATGTLPIGYTPSTPLQHVDLEDVAEVTAKIILEGERHHFATYELCGSDYVSHDELAQSIASLSGKPVKAVLTTAPMGRTAPGPVVSGGELADYRLDGLERLFDHYGSYGITGNPNVLRWLLGREPTKFSAYVRRCLDLK